MWRSILAVGSGYIAISLTTVVTFIVLNTLAPGQLNEPAWLVGKLSLAVFGAVVGGIVTARLASTQPLLHTFALAAVMVVLAAVAVVVSFGSEPLWFQLSLILTSGLATVVGGHIAIWGGRLAAR